MEQKQKSKIAVTVIPGDGIGAEVVHATQRLIDATGAPIAWEEYHAGASIFKKGIASGVPEDTIASIHRTKVALKGPLETPVGFGEKSANVTLRKLFETFGNIRPVREIPGVKTPYSGRNIDLVIVRENVEDLYAGIEHMQTEEVAQCLKLISKKGCEKIVRLAFEVARSQGRKRVHCATKSNIMKLTEGLLKRTFEAIAPEYPEIEAQHIIVDNCAHQLVKLPEQFDVIVTTNMNGDILSDLTSALIGGLGFAPSANIGNTTAIFEAVHGSAPKYAGKNVINPTAMILSGVMMLRHIGLFDEATLLENAVLTTLEEGRAMTRDVVGDKLAASTTAYTEAILNNFGKVPKAAETREHKKLHLEKCVLKEATAANTQTERKVVGVDVFIESKATPETIGKKLEELTFETPFKLKMISNRGTKLYPSSGAITDTVNHWRCRFMLGQQNLGVTSQMLNSLLGQIEKAYDWMHIEKLQEFGGKAGYTKAQGED